MCDYTLITQNSGERGKSWRFPASFTGNWYYPGINEPIFQESEMNIQVICQRGTQLSCMLSLVYIQRDHITDPWNAAKKKTPLSAKIICNSQAPQWLNMSLKDHLRSLTLIFPRSWIVLGSGATPPPAREGPSTKAPMAQPITEHH